MDRIHLGYDEASFLSRSLMIWVYSLVQRVKGKELSLKELPEIPNRFEFNEKCQEISAH